MSKHIDGARTLVRDAEKALQGMVSGAAKSGAYDDVVILGDVARLFAQMHQRLDVGAGDRPTSVTDPPPQPNKRKSQDPKRLAKTATSSIPAKSNAPRFHRDGTDLVKTAWSRQKKAEYEHRAPFRVARLLASRIVEVGGGSRLAPSEKFFPLIDPDDQMEIPSYQGYLCLAWLVQEGLVGKHGRRGYAVFRAGSLEEDLEQRWEKLPRS